MTGSTLELSTGHSHAVERSAIWNRDQLDLLKRTVARGTSDDEFALFCHVASRSGLDPFARQIYAVMRWDSRAGREVMAIQTGIDGYRLIADRTGRYVGNDDAVFDGLTDSGYPDKATVTVWKLVDGIRAPFSASARWEEYYPGEKQGAMWRKMPHVMLAKVAEALALRKAFPADLSGVYTSEEMGQAGGGHDASVDLDDPFAGWDGKDEHDQVLASIRARVAGLPDAEREKLAERFAAAAFGKPPYSPHVMGAYDRLVSEFETVDGEVVEEAAWSDEDERPFGDGE